MEIDTLIGEQNPQWSDEKYLPVENSWFKRGAYSEVNHWLDKRFIITLTGLRRVGKSTILRQIMSNLILKGKRKECFYFSFEKFQAKRDPEILKRIIQYYFDFVLIKKSYQISEKIYIFLDEVQYIPYWQDVIKFFYDQNENFKFIVTGSNSLFVQKKSLESLAGRIIDIKITPLLFKEYLSLVNPDYKIDIKNDLWISANKNIINGYFEKYLRFGQFPEAIYQKLNNSDTKKYLESIENKITQEDLPKTFTIEHPQILMVIINQIKKQPGQIIEYQNIASQVGLDQRTLANYFGYLEKVFLISLCYNFGKKPIKAPRISKKAYLVSSNFATEAPMPFLVENYIFNYLKIKFPGVYFNKDKEIDFIAVKDEKNYLFEVKYQNEINSSDSKNIKAFLKVNKAVKSFLITKDKFDLKKPIDQIPASLIEFLPIARFSLGLGKNIWNRIDAIEYVKKERESWDKK